MTFWAGMRYCPKCGTPFATGGFEATPYPTCAACGFVFFRGPSVGAGCLVVEDGKLLLAQRGIEPHRASWYVPSGFADYGEDPETTALRELTEETGLTARIVRLYDVRAWHDDPRKDGVMLAYLAERIAGDAAPNDDVTALGWFAPDALPAPITFQTHRGIIHKWADETRQAQVRHERVSD